MKTVEEKVLSAIKQTSDSKDPFPAGSSSPEFYYKFLYELSRNFQPEVSIELGTWHGSSAYCMKAGHPAGRVVTVDISDQVWDAFKNIGVEFALSDSAQQAKNFSEGVVDILFIDTVHDGVTPLNEFHAWLPKMKGACIICFDDISLNNEMVEFWKKFNPVGFKKIETDLHGSAGFGIIFRETL